MKTQTTNLIKKSSLELAQMIQKLSNDMYKENSACIAIFGEKSFRESCNAAAVQVVMQNHIEG